MLHEHPRTLDFTTFSLSFPIQDVWVRFHSFQVQSACYQMWRQTSQTSRGRKLGLLRFLVL
jgi:hypothetical protein